MRGHALGGKLTVRQLEDAVEDFGSLAITRYPLSSMMRLVLDLRSNFTAYDATYVVLAQVLDVPLVTADVKLVAARALGVNVQVLRPSQ